MILNKEIKIIFKPAYDNIFKSFVEIKPLIFQVDKTIYQTEKVILNARIFI